MGGIESLELGTCQSYKSSIKRARLDLSWQLANRVNGDKDQRFVEAAFDDQGGLGWQGAPDIQPPRHNLTTI